MVKSFVFSGNPKLFFCKRCKKTFKSGQYFDCYPLAQARCNACGRMTSEFRRKKW